MAKRRKATRRRPAAAGGFPSARKKPREEPAPDSEYLNPAWRLACTDTAGPFGWNAITEMKLLEVRRKLSDLEASTWHEILVGQKHRNHTVQIVRLCPQARKRLSEIRQDDVEELISLRLSGRERVWGIRDAGILYLLWWDPGHQVCPALLGHT